jgi:hypothetical protein
MSYHHNHHRHDDRKGLGKDRPQPTARHIQAPEPRQPQPLHHLRQDLAAVLPVSMGMYICMHAKGMWQSVASDFAERRDVQHIQWRPTYKLYE